MERQQPGAAPDLDGDGQREEGGRHRPRGVGQGGPARVRVDSWQEGEYARAGVGLDTDEVNGWGYNLVFDGRRNDNQGWLEFVDDRVVWSGDQQSADGSGPGAVRFDWNVGTWYWFRFKADGSKLYGKVWADGTTEPSSWTLTFDGTGLNGWDKTGGDASVNGGSSGGHGKWASYTTASFDDVSVWTTSPAPSAAGAPTVVPAVASGTPLVPAPADRPAAVPAIDDHVLAAALAGLDLSRGRPATVPVARAGDGDPLDPADRSADGEPGAFVAVGDLGLDLI